MSNQLFNKSYSFDDVTFRNIPQTRKEFDPFDDLTTDGTVRKQAHTHAQISKVIDIKSGKLSADKKAINYGFKLNHWKAAIHKWAPRVMRMLCPS